MPPAVRVDLWTVRPSRVPVAFARMGWDRRVRHRPGLRFAKLVGTGDGRTFTPRDADPLRWGLVSVWDTEAAARAFGTDPVARGWDRIATEHLQVQLRPLAARGRWSGVQPFGEAPSGGPGPDEPPRWTGPVASLTRARIRPTHWRRFWRSVPPVSADLHTVPGLRLAVGIGEAPVGLQGTFSVWDSARDLNRFAYRRPEHSEVVARTPAEGWYSEELFARFAVRSVSGTFAGADLAGLTDLAGLGADPTGLGADPTGLGADPTGDRRA